MISLAVGVILIAFTVFAVLPSMPLNWGAEVIAFLKGCAPVFAAFIGLICLFIGAADIKDKNEVRKEEIEARARDEAENK